MGGRVARRVIAAATAIGLALGLGACAAEAPTIDLGIDQVESALPDTVREQLQAVTETAMTATGSSGAIVGVYAPWSGEWVAGLGTTTPGGAEVDPSMTFKAPGVTRAMTCDVLYALAADGTVQLDDTVTSWLETYPNQDDITLEQLCDSTSGLRPYLDQLLRRVVKTPERVWNPRELIAYGLAQGRAFDPGARFGDADTGYVLLGIVLERASGMSMDDLYRKYVFGPVGMASSSLPRTAGDPANRLGGLRSGTMKGGAPNCAEPTDLTALSSSVGFSASGVVSDVDDLAQYARSLAAQARSYDVPQRFEQTRQVSGDAPTWFTADGGAYQAGSLVGQHGSIPGYLTAAYADRETGLTVVVVLNNSRASSSVARLLAWQLAAIASKAPAADGRTAPEAGFPWTAESLAASVSRLAVCSE